MNNKHKFFSNLKYIIKRIFGFILNFTWKIIWPIFLLSFTLVPIIWLFMNSVKPKPAIFSERLVLIFTPTFHNWISLFQQTEVRNGLYNSFTISFTSTILVVIIAGFAAYAFSRYHFPGRKRLLFLFVCSRLLPPISAVIVLFLLFSRFGLIDTRSGLVLIYVGLLTPMAVWLLKNAFDSVPKDIEEMALIDGCNRINAVVRITLPVAAPNIAASSLIIFITIWNEFMFASLFTRSHARTMTVVLTESLGEFEIYWGELAAMGSFLLIPLLIASIIAQRYLVEGLSAGALK